MAYYFLTAFIFFGVGFFLGVVAKSPADFKENE